VPSGASSGAVHDSCGVARRLRGERAGGGRAMSETLWLLAALFGFAVVGQTLAHIFALRRSLRDLEEEVAEATQTIFEARRKSEWLEARVQDLLDAAQLRSGDAQAAWQQLEQVTRSIKADAMVRGYNVGLADIDQPD